MSSIDHRAGFENLIQFFISVPYCEPIPSIHITNEHKLRSAGRRKRWQKEDEGNKEGWHCGKGELRNVAGGDEG